MVNGEEHTDAIPGAGRERNEGERMSTDAAFRRKPFRSIRQRIRVEARIAVHADDQHHDVRVGGNFVFT